MTEINKAAEEGELPELPEANMFVGQNLYSAKQMRHYAQTAIAADRASRQVASKAEVEQNSIIADLYKWLARAHFARNADEIRAAAFGERLQELLATPPATTGASTALTDERIKDICNESGFGETGFTLRFARAIEREVAAQAGQVAVPEERIIYEIQTPDGKWLECTQRIYKLAEGGNRRAVKIVPAPRS